MGDYIKRKDAMELINKCVSHTSPKVKVMDFRHGEMNGLNWACDTIEAMPSTDVAPVLRGHWIKISPAGIYECSECGKNVMTSDIEAYEYCHGCGARMDGEEMFDYGADLQNAYDEGYKKGKADAVRHGWWLVIDTEEPRRYGCSECKRFSWNLENYCPNCGARMDGEE